jgi:hypothetical protein
MKVFLLDISHLSNIFSSDQILEELQVRNEIGYISKNTKETFRVAQVLLNDNSICFINLTNKDQVKEIHQVINLFRNRSNYNESEDENICVISNSVLQVFGLVDRSNNVDYINFNNKEKINNKEISIYEKMKDDIIYNPNNHFFYDGIKFSTLDIVAEMKLKSLKLKDYFAIKKFNGWSPNINFKIIRYEINKSIEICKLKIIRCKLSYIKMKRDMYE